MSDLVLSMLWRKRETVHPEYWGERCSRFYRFYGSYVEEVFDFPTLEQFFRDLDDPKQVRIQDLPKGVYKKGYEYYKGLVPEQYHAFQYTCRLYELSDEDMTRVYIRRKEGENIAAELVCDSPHFQPVPVSTCLFISNASGLVTWYPGDDFEVGPGSYGLGGFMVKGKRLDL